MSRIRILQDIWFVITEENVDFSGLFCIIFLWPYNLYQFNLRDCRLTDTADADTVQMAIYGSKVRTFESHRQVQHCEIQLPNT